MKVGRYSIGVHNHGFFRLDGGAMFGSVPKTLWAREAPPDEDNRILLATRSLVIEDGERRILVDVGCGDKWSEKNRAIFCIPEAPYVPLDGVTDVLLTHLHFDHGGGVSRFVDGELRASYPNARHFVSQANFDNARRPNVRERASYLAENIDVLPTLDLRLTEEGQQLFPGITVHQSNGHTRGLQWVKLSEGGETILYPADLIPTSKHLPIPFVMGYDMCAELALEEKRAFLEMAVATSAIIVFEHDPNVAAARVRFDDRGRAVIAEEIELALV